MSLLIAVLLSAIWIDKRNKVLQARSMTIDAEVSNLESILKDLKELSMTYSRSKASSMKVDQSLLAKHSKHLLTKILVAQYDKQKKPSFIMMC